MGPLPVIADQLLCGIRDMGAEGGQEIESRTGDSAWRIPAGAAIVALEIIGDLTIVGVVMDAHYSLSATGLQRKGGSFSDQQLSLKKKMDD